MHYTESEEIYDLSISGEDNREVPHTHVVVEDQRLEEITHKLAAAAKKIHDGQTKIKDFIGPYLPGRIIGFRNQDLLLDPSNFRKVMAGNPFISMTLDHETQQATQETARRTSTIIYVGLNLLLGAYDDDDIILRKRQEIARDLQSDSSGTDRLLNLLQNTGYLCPYSAVDFELTLEHDILAPMQRTGERFAPFIFHQEKGDLKYDAPHLMMGTGFAFFAFEGKRPRIGSSYDVEDELRTAPTDPTLGHYSITGGNTDYELAKFNKVLLTKIKNS